MDEEMKKGEGEGGSNYKQSGILHCFPRAYRKRDGHQTILLHLPKLKTTVSSCIKMGSSTADCFGTINIMDPGHERVKG